MGTCFTTTAPKRAELSDVHLLQNDTIIKNAKQQRQHLNNFSDCDQHDFEYRGFNTETSNDSNLNPVFPSGDSSPKHRRKSNEMIYGNNVNTYNDHYHTNLIKLNSDLQRQIDILKQCSNDEIKMLKARIQSLEKQFREASIAIHDNKVINTECNKGTQTKLCPNVYRIIKVSQIYNKRLRASYDKEHINEEQIWNTMNTQKEYNLSSLILDYTHLLLVHCNNNNIFELKIVYLEIKDILNSFCDNKQCKCIRNIKETSFEANGVYILDIIHCFLYHGYTNDRNITDRDCINRQVLRDCIMDKNEEIIEYNKRKKGSNVNISIDTSMVAMDAQTLNIKKKIYSRTPPTAINRKYPKVNIVCIKKRHNSVNSGVSNLSRRSSSRSIHSTPKSSRSSISALSQDNNNEMKLILSPNQSKLSAMKMSEDRVRKLSGTMNEIEIKELIDEYDNNQQIVIENDDNDDDELVINPSEKDEERSSTLDDDERAEIVQFKMEHHQEDKQRKGSKHNLMRLQQGNEWDVQSMDQTRQDMKRQLLHLALTSSIDVHQ